MTTTVACTNINLLTEAQMPASPSNTELYAVELSGQPMDTNASNATSTGKATIVGWGMPDYSAGVSGISLPYTSTMNGFVYIKLYNYERYSEIYVNGVVMGYTGGSGYNRDSYLIPVKSGDIVSVNGYSALEGTTFFPTIGG